MKTTPVAWERPRTGSGQVCSPSPHLHGAEARSPFWTTKEMASDRWSDCGDLRSSTYLASSLRHNARFSHKETVKRVGTWLPQANRRQELRNCGTLNIANSKWLYLAPDRLCGLHGHYCLEAVAVAGNQVACAQTQKSPTL
jgi:hypothetical protein